MFMGVIDSLKKKRDARLKICNGCEHLDKSRCCALCGCPVDKKTWVPLFSCPRKKW